MGSMQYKMYKYTNGNSDDTENENFTTSHQFNVPAKNEPSTCILYANCNNNNNKNQEIRYGNKKEIGRKTTTKNEKKMRNKRYIQIN